MAKKAAKESSLPLVISLVFFVLTTIGLGVFVYVLYSDQAGKDAAAAKAAADVKTARSQTAEAELKLSMYRNFVGIGGQEDRDALSAASATALEPARKELERVNTEAGKRVADAITAEVRARQADGLKQFAAPATMFAWRPDAEGKLPPAPTTVLLDGMVKAYADREVALAAKAVAEKGYTDAVAAMEKTAKDYQAAADEFKKAAAAVPTDSNAKLAAMQKQMSDRLALFGTQVAAHAKQIAAAADTNQEIVNANKRLEAEKQAVVDNLEALKQRIPKPDMFKYDDPHGKVLRRLPEDMVEINLGQADLVRPGLTFTVLPSDFPQKGMSSRMRQVREPDDRGQFRAVTRFVPKASIEVVEVMGPSLSKARIVGGTEDDVRDRVMPNDLLYNAAWKKGASDHVALIGMFDTNGDGSDDIQRVVTDLTKMGIPVDAYYDLSKKAWVGQITTRTRYLIEGQLPSPRSSNDPHLAAKTELIGKLNEARKSATDKGIQVVLSRDFFPRMGYKAKVDLTEDQINQATSRYLQGIVGGTDGAAPDGK